MNRYGRSVNIIGGTFKRAHFHDEWRNWSGVASWVKRQWCGGKKGPPHDRRMWGGRFRVAGTRKNDTYKGHDIISYNNTHPRRSGWGRYGSVVDREGGGLQEGNPINPSVAEPRANPMPHSSARDLRGWCNKNQECLLKRAFSVKGMTILVCSAIDIQLQCIYILYINARALILQESRWHSRRSSNPPPPIDRRDNSPLPP